MREATLHKIELLENGFTIIDNIYSAQEIEQILEAINNADTIKETFRKSRDLFAIRQFLKEIPSNPFIKSFFILNVNRDGTGETRECPFSLSIFQMVGLLPDDNNKNSASIILSLK